MWFRIACTLLVNLYVDLQARSCLEKDTVDWSTITGASLNSTTRLATMKKFLSTTTFCPVGTGCGTGSLPWQMPLKTSTPARSPQKRWSSHSSRLRIVWKDQAAEEHSLLNPLICPEHKGEASYCEITITTTNQNPVVWKH